MKISAFAGFISALFLLSFHSPALSAPSEKRKSPNEEIAPQSSKSIRTETSTSASSSSKPSSQSVWATPSSAHGRAYVPTIAQNASDPEFVLGLEWNKIYRKAYESTWEARGLKSDENLKRVLETVPALFKFNDENGGKYLNLGDAYYFNLDLGTSARLLATRNLSEILKADSYFKLAVEYYVSASKMDKDKVINHGQEWLAYAFRDLAKEALEGKSLERHSNARLDLVIESLNHAIQRYQKYSTPTSKSEDAITAYRARAKSYFVLALRKLKNHPSTPEQLYRSAQVDLLEVLRLHGDEISFNPINTTIRPGEILEIYALLAASSFYLSNNKQSPSDVNYAFKYADFALKINDQLIRDDPNQQKHIHLRPSGRSELSHIIASIQKSTMPGDNVSISNSISSAAASPTHLPEPSTKTWEDLVSRFKEAEKIVDLNSNSENIQNAYFRLTEMLEFNAKNNSKFLTKIDIFNYFIKCGDLATRVVVESGNSEKVRERFLDSAFYSYSRAEETEKSLPQYPLEGSNADPSKVARGFSNIANSVIRVQKISELSVAELVLIRNSLSKVILLNTGYKSNHNKQNLLDLSELKILLNTLRVILQSRAKREGEWISDDFQFSLLNIDAEVEAAKQDAIVFQSGYKIVSPDESIVFKAITAASAAIYFHNSNINYLHIQHFKDLSRLHFNRGKSYCLLAGKPELSNEKRKEFQELALNDLKSQSSWEEKVGSGWKLLVASEQLETTQILNALRVFVGAGDLFNNPATSTGQSITEAPAKPFNAKHLIRIPNRFKREWNRRPRLNSVLSTSAPRETKLQTQIKFLNVLKISKPISLSRSIYEFSKENEKIRVKWLSYFDQLPQSNEKVTFILAGRGNGATVPLPEAGMRTVLILAPNQSEVAEELTREGVDVCVVERLKFNGKNLKPKRIGYFTSRRLAAFEIAHLINLNQILAVVDDNIQQVRVSEKLLDRAPGPVSISGLNTNANWNSLFQAVEKSLTAKQGTLIGLNEFDPKQEPKDPASNWLLVRQAKGRLESGFSSKIFFFDFARVREIAKGDYSQFFPPHIKFPQEDLFFQLFLSQSDQNVFQLDRSVAEYKRFTGPSLAKQFISENDIKSEDWLDDQYDPDGRNPNRDAVIQLIRSIVERDIADTENENQKLGFRDFSQTRSQRASGVLNSQVRISNKSDGNGEEKDEKKESPENDANQGAWLPPERSVEGKATFSELKRFGSRENKSNWSKLIKSLRSELSNGLWPHQKEAISKITTFIESKMDTMGLKAPARFIEMATGTGKSRIIAEIAKKAQNSLNAGIIIVTPGIELQEQLGESLYKEIENLTFISSGQGNIRSKIAAQTWSMNKQGKVKVFVESSFFEYLRHRKGDIPDTSIIIFDEFHKMQPRFKRILKEIENFNGLMLGFSATPRIGPNNPFNESLFTYTTNQGVAQKYLAPWEVRNIQVEKGNFATLLPRILSTEVHPMGGLLKDHSGVIYVKEKGKKKSTVKFLDELAKNLRDNNIAAESFHSRLSREERRLRLARFKAKETKVLVALKTLREGFDSSQMDYVFMTGQKSDLATMIQIRGRVLRPFEDQAPNQSPKVSLVLTSFEEGLDERIVFNYQDVNIDRNALNISPDFDALVARGEPHYIAEGVPNSGEVELNQEAEEYMSSPLRLSPEVSAESSPDSAMPSTPTPPSTPLPPSSSPKMDIWDELRRQLDKAIADEAAWDELPRALDEALMTDEAA